MPIPLLPRSARHGRTALDRAETALFEEYSALVRLAYLTLPPSLSKHRRILLAHSLVQRSLPGSRERDPGPHLPKPRGTGRPSVTQKDRLRGHVLRSAIAYGRPPRGWPHRLPPPRTLLPVLPVVWGLRLFPRAGGADDLAPGRALAGSTAPARAAFVLRSVDERTDAAIATLLHAAGVTDPEGALGAATRLAESAGRATQTLLGSREFDACTVQTGPTDLLRRRRRVRFLWGALSALVFTGVLLAVSAPGSAPPSAGDIPAGATLPGPADLVRTPRDSWADTARVDFTAWPARGARADDPELLARALSTWARPTRAAAAEAAGNGLDARRTAAVLGCDSAFASRVEGARARLKRMVERGWLVEAKPGRFALPASGKADDAGAAGWPGDGSCVRSSTTA